ncbi:hypothetical protein MTO96_036497 [Rhipicephalus appendiculatus]
MSEHGEPPQGETRSHSTAQTTRSNDHARCNTALSALFGLWRELAKPAGPPRLGSTVGFTYVAADPEHSLNLADRNNKRIHFPAQTVIRSRSNRGFQYGGLPAAKYARCSVGSMQFVASYAA